MCLKARVGLCMGHGCGRVLRGCATTSSVSVFSCSPMLFNPTHPYPRRMHCSSPPPRRARALVGLRR